jgi:hypothetical protein
MKLSMMIALVVYLGMGIWFISKGCDKKEIESEVVYSDSCRVEFMGNLDNKHMVRMDDTIWTLVPFALGR